MDLIISDHSVPLAKADRAPKKVIDPTPQYATDGDPAKGIPATILTAAHYNSLMSEIVNAIIAGGDEPNKDSWNQLADIITKFINKIDSLNGRFDTIKKEVGKDAQGVYVIYEDNGKDQKTYILSPSDLDDINKRLSAAEGTITNHTGRLDNYGDAINRIFNNELPSKAALNGNGDQDFSIKNLNASGIVTGGLGVGGTNGVGSDSALWSLSPALQPINSVPSRRAFFNFYYAGADESDQQTAASRQVIQVVANRSKYIDSSGPASSQNDDVIHTRSVNVMADTTVYGNLTVFRQSTFMQKATFKNGADGEKGDLAESYKSDRKDYKLGQVMMRAVNKGNEVELCTNPKRVFGVISTSPMLTMNIQNENNPDYQRYVRIALLGRVPVWVEGPLTIDDHITATDHGTAIASQDPSDIWIGWPIEPDPREELRLVECFVKAVI